MRAETSKYRRTWRRKNTQKTQWKKRDNHKKVSPMRFGHRALQEVEESAEVQNIVPYIHFVRCPGHMPLTVWTVE